MSLGRQERKFSFYKLKIKCQCVPPKRYWFSLKKWLLTFWDRQVRRWECSTLFQKARKCLNYDMNVWKGQESV